MKVIPVGALGVVSNTLEEYLGELDISQIQTCMQKSAIIGSTAILKTVLNS